MLAINFNYMLVLTALGCLSLFFLSSEKKLYIVLLFSLFGTYIFGGEQGGVNLLPGPLICVVYMLFLLYASCYSGRLSLSRFKFDLILVFFLLYALFVTVMVPLVFSSDIQVIRPGLIEYGIRHAVPLAWTSSTVAQFSYLIIDAILIYVVIQCRQNGCDQKIISNFINFNINLSLLFGFFVVLETFLCLLQIKVDFFSWFLGPSFFEGRSDRYYLGDVFGFPIRRAQAVFGEPSFFSTYMVGVYGVLLFYSRVKPKFSNLIKCIVILLSLIFSFSTTATIALIVMTLLVMMVPINLDDGVDILIKRGFSAKKLTISLFVFVILILVIYFIFSSDMVSDYLFGKLSNTDGYEKGNYSSGAERLYWDVTAFYAFLDSKGLGIGAGGTRASSFIVNLLAAYGVFGILIFILLVKKFLVMLFSLSGNGVYFENKLAILLCLGWFLGMSISVPDGFSNFYLWIGVGMAIPKFATHKNKYRN